jgi:hypothetical protein
MAALVIVCGLIVACSANDKTIAVPAFSIAVKLSEMPRQKLQGLHESVLVIAYFDSDPLPGKEKDNAPMRGVVLRQRPKLVISYGVVQVYIYSRLPHGFYDEPATIGHLGLNGCLRYHDAPIDRKTENFRTPLLCRSIRT